MNVKVILEILIDILIFSQYLTTNVQRSLMLGTHVQSLSLCLSHFDKILPVIGLVGEDCAIKNNDIDGHWSNIQQREQNLVQIFITHFSLLNSPLPDRCIDYITIWSEILNYFFSK